MPYPSASQGWLLLLCVLLSCRGAGGGATIGIADRARFEHAVQGRVTVWARAINNGSLDTLSDLYLHGRDLLIVWPDGERTIGWPDASAKWGTWAAGPSHLSFFAENPSVDILDQHVALVTFSSSTTRAGAAAGGGQSSTITGRVMQVWVRDEQRNWRIRAEETAPQP
jgi:ketosteroid isomerase-like protein